MLHVNETKCIGCACCMPYCPEEALWVWVICQVDPAKCTECLTCLEWCPVEALEVRQ